MLAILSLMMFLKEHIKLDAAAGQWTRGKGCDTFCPIGPYLVTKDEINRPQNLSIWLELNGKKVQNGNTKTMVFNIKQLVSYVSHFMTFNQVIL